MRGDGESGTEGNESEDDTQYNYNDQQGYAQYTFDYMWGTVLTIVFYNSVCLNILRSTKAYLYLILYKYEVNIIKNNLMSFIVAK